MARRGGKDRGIVFKKGAWWVRITHKGRERRRKCDNKSQATTLYGRLKADIRENKYFPEKDNQPEEITLKAWIHRCLESSTNRDKVHESQRALYWATVFGSRLLSDITTEDIRRQHAKMLASG